MLAVTFLLTIVLGLSSSAPSPRCHRQHGQCDGEAINFIREMASLEDCKGRCDNQSGCHFYSYHGSSGGEAHHRHCYLYSSCDSLRLPGQNSHWVSGSTEYHSECFSAPKIVAVSNLLRPT